MVKILVYSFLFNIIFVLSGISQESVGCRDFTQIDVDILNKKEYIPDGRFNSVKLTEGDKIQVYKPFYSGRKYMIIVSCEDNLDGLDVELTDMTKKVIYKSDQSQKRHEIVYEPDKNQNLIISVSVKTIGEQKISVKACVNVVVGFKM